MYLFAYRHFQCFCARFLALEICSVCGIWMKVKVVDDYVLEIEVSLVSCSVDCEAKLIEICCVETVMEICDVLG